MPNQPSASSNKFSKNRLCDAPSFLKVFKSTQLRKTEACRAKTVEVSGAGLASSLLCSSNMTAVVGSETKHTSSFFDVYSSRVTIKVRSFLKLVFLIDVFLCSYVYRVPREFLISLTCFITAVFSSLGKTPLRLY